MIHEIIVPHFNMGNLPGAVSLCGSTRFYIEKYNNLLFISIYLINGIV